MNDWIAKTARWAGCLACKPLEESGICATGKKGPRKRKQQVPGGRNSLSTAHRTFRKKPAWLECSEHRGRVQMSQEVSKPGKALGAMGSKKGYLAPSHMVDKWQSQNVNQVFSIISSVFAL